MEVSGTGLRVFLVDDLKAPLPEKGQSHRPLTGMEFWKVSWISLFFLEEEKEEKTRLRLSFPSLSSACSNEATRV